MSNDTTNAKPQYIVKYLRNALALEEFLNDNFAQGYTLKHAGEDNDGTTVIMELTEPVSNAMALPENRDELLNACNLAWTTLKNIQYGVLDKERIGAVYIATERAIRNAGGDPYK